MGLVFSGQQDYLLYLEWYYSLINTDKGGMNLWGLGVKFHVCLTRNARGSRIKTHIAKKYRNTSNPEETAIVLLVDLPQGCSEVGFIFFRILQGTWDKSFTLVVTQRARRPRKALLTFYSRGYLVALNLLCLDSHRWRLRSIQFHHLDKTEIN